MIKGLLQNNSWAKGVVVILQGLGMNAYVCWCILVHWHAAYFCRHACAKSKTLVPKPLNP